MKEQKSVFRGLCAGLLAACLMTAVQLRRFFWGGLTGLLYFVLIFIISMAVNAGIPSPDGFLTALLLCTGGGMLGAILS